jgi:hypothetical protein
MGDVDVGRCLSVGLRKGIVEMEMTLFLYSCHLIIVAANK